MRIQLPMNLKVIFKALLISTFLIGSAFLVIAICHWAVESASSQRLYSDASKIPGRKAALLLGCAKILENGRQNSYFHHRINAASELYRAGKCQYIIVSGDNSRKGYDEPTDMQEALIAKGVPEKRIYRDFAGFRTLDSVVRAKEIFGQDEIIIVSQPFHNKRAIFLASKNGIDAIGFNCREVTSFAGLKTKFRESLARVKMVLDVYLLGTKPKYLGPKVQLGGPQPQHGT